MPVLREQGQLSVNDPGHDYVFCSYSDDFPYDFHTNVSTHIYIYIKLDFTIDYR